MGSQQTQVLKAIFLKSTMKSTNKGIITLSFDCEAKWGMADLDEPEWLFKLNYDAIMLTKGNTDYTYGDGTIENWSWTGTPHNSTSFGPALPQ